MTGDKLETAISIAYSCELIKNENKLILKAASTEME